MDTQRAELGIDGNAAFALLGEDLQVGESEWVELPPSFLGDGPCHSVADEVRCAQEAFERLRDRLKRPDLRFYFGPSHPYGN